MLVYDVGKKETRENLQNKDGFTIPTSEIVYIDTDKVDDDIYQSISDGAKVLYIPFNWFPYSRPINMQVAKIELYPDLRPTSDQEFYFTKGLGKYSM